LFCGGGVVVGVGKCGVLWEKKGVLVGGGGGGGGRDTVTQSNLIAACVFLQKGSAQRLANSDQNTGFTFNVN